MIGNDTLDTNWYLHRATLPTRLCSGAAPHVNIWYAHAHSSIQRVISAGNLFICACTNLHDHIRTWPSLLVIDHWLSPEVYCLEGRTTTQPVLDLRTRLSLCPGVGSRSLALAIPSLLGREDDHPGVHTGDRSTGPVLHFNGRGWNLTRSSSL